MLPNELLAAAKECIKSHTKVLISYTIEIEKVAAIELFKKGAVDYQGKRVFWQNPQRTLTLAGIGQTECFQSSHGKESYQELEQFKEALKQRLSVIVLFQEQGLYLLEALPSILRNRAVANGKNFKKRIFVCLRT